MSLENVELTYRAADAFNRRDLDAFLGLMDPEVEFTTRFASPKTIPSIAAPTASANGGTICSRSSLT